MAATRCRRLVSIPKHIAIIMDGNGRWAEARGLPRHAGHKEGVRPVRMCIEECARRGVGALTLFAFSSENWQRPVDRSDEPDAAVPRRHRPRGRGPAQEQGAAALHRRPARAQRQAAGAHGGERSSSPPRTPGCKLQVAVSYGGRWDIVQAARRLAARRRERRAARSTPSTRSASRASSQLGDARRSRSVHPHRRRSPHQQFPAVESRLHRAARLRRVVAGFRRARISRRRSPSFAGRERRFGLTREQAREAAQRA